MNYVLEIAAFNLQSALAAAKAGADRIELCENQPEGGVTPSYGALKIAREKISIPVFPIIRPRGGDFLYTDDEFAALLTDIRLCKELGFEGVVTGVLKADGTVDTERMKRIAEIAYPMELTCHRAFDRTRDALEALEAVIECGFDRILTSGQQPDAVSGIALIQQLVTAADERIVILPGAGVTAENIVQIATATGVHELHSSARMHQPSAMQFQHRVLGQQLNSIFVDTSEIQTMKQLLAAL